MITNTFIDSCIEELKSKNLDDFGIRLGTDTESQAFKEHAIGVSEYWYIKKGVYYSKPLKEFNTDLILYSITKPFKKK